MLKHFVSYGLAAVVVVLAAAHAWNSWKTPQGSGAASDDWFVSDMVAPGAFVHTDPDRAVTVLTVSQGLSDEVRRQYPHADQGSLMTPYDVFLNLELADSEALFIGDAHMSSLRYLPSPKSDSNPDGLPIGFTKGEEPWDGEIHAGINCLACHAGLIKAGDRAMFIIGAPTQADFQTMTVHLRDALVAAHTDEAKLARLAGRLGVTDDSGREALRGRVQQAADAMVARVALNDTSAVYGYGRVDAVGQIFNSVASANLNLPQNRADPDAPVSYPHIWGTAQANVVQYTGFAPNYIPGSILLRNIGEVLGVFGRVELDGGREHGWLEIGYPSSVNVTKLGELEEWLNNLEPPAWPSEVFGPIDAELAETGKAIYAANCIGCHAVVTPYEDYKVVLVAPDEIGTDPLTATNSLQTGVTPDGKEMQKLKMLIRQALGVAIDDPVEALESMLDEAILDKWGGRGGYTYKARPLNGIWATAPFLHNGSVPTLDDLLRPAADRPKAFTLGGWEYDPVRVGFMLYDGSDKFVFDTALPGNSNAGHDGKAQGAELSDEERRALLEYLKTL